MSDILENVKRLKAELEDEFGKPEHPDMILMTHESEDLLKSKFEESDAFSGSAQSIGGLPYEVYSSHLQCVERALVLIDEGKSVWYVY